MRWLTIVIASWCGIAVADGLTRPQVVAAMKAIRPRLDACYAKYGVAGVAVVDLTIAPAGTVATAELEAAGHSIGDIAAASPTGGCVLEAVLAARFPRFDGPAQTLVYPLVIGKTTRADVRGSCRDTPRPRRRAPPPSVTAARTCRA